MIDSSEQLFLLVVEAGSLKQAANIINADPSSVSRKVATLESRLGVKLIQRSTKRSVPTEAGELYYAELKQLHEQKIALEEKVAGSQETPSGRLRVAAPIDFGVRFVAPILTAMQDDFPELAIDLVLGSNFVDLAEHGVDVAVRIGHLPDSNLVAQRLGNVPRIIVASSQCLDQFIHPKAPQDLQHLPFIFYRSGQSHEAIKMNKNGATLSVNVSGKCAINNMTAIRNAVLADQGAHFGPLWFFADDIRQGRLVSVLPDHKLNAFPLQTVYPQREYLPAKVRIFNQRLRHSIEHNNVLQTLPES